MLRFPTRKSSAYGVVNKDMLVQFYQIEICFARNLFHNNVKNDVATTITMNHMII